jgi:hypothetical protein
LAASRALGSGMILSISPKIGPISDAMSAI